ncbi:NADH dehydrogenase [ubiquinone] 1 beta subcomplex subunit 10-like [Atheta coriaria]|uniref:NADH dehydrogenase [ubiquinone] 1 beta subcomplex subunit 10-like n=1 Tax=Dalotia coriaria TaxID=877792 RepID=UPI0031F3EF69
MTEFDETPEPPIKPQERKKNYFEKFFCVVSCTLNKPVEILHDTFVTPDRKEYAWYHQKFPRVPTIDECYEDDLVCFSEANYQYKRDRLVDSEIIRILRQRFENCVMYETPQHLERCDHLLKEYEEASTNWFTKYGDLGGYHNVTKCYMKQKHRLLWERKYGEVGTGMNEKVEEDIEDDEKNQKHGC